MHFGAVYVLISVRQPGQQIPAAELCHKQDPSCLGHLKLHSKSLILRRPSAPSQPLAYLSCRAVTFADLNTGWESAGFSDALLQAEPGPKHRRHSVCGWS